MFYTGNLANPFVARPPNPRAIVRLFCLPYAGAGSSRYFRWSAQFPPTVDICPLLLPGRESRIWEAPYRDVAELIGDLCEDLQPEISRPFAFFGHSMGALIAFEVARQFRRSSGQLPLHLFASACRSPQSPDSEDFLHRLPETEFLMRLRSMNYAPDAIYDDPQFMKILLPTIRADYQLCETYRYASEPPLDCPITAFGGSEDRWVTRTHLDDWGAQTAVRFARTMFSGGHLFLHKHEAAIADVIVTDLEETLLAKT